MLMSAQTHMYAYHLIIIAQTVGMLTQRQKTEQFCGVFSQKSHILFQA